MAERVRIEREGDVAVVLIDNPPINAGSLDVRAGVLAAVVILGGAAPLSSRDPTCVSSASRWPIRNCRR